MASQNNLRAGPPNVEERASVITSPPTFVTSIGELLSQTGGDPIPSGDKFKGGFLCTGTNRQSMGQFNDPLDLGGCDSA